MRVYSFLFSLLLPPLPSLSPLWSHLTDLCPENAEFGVQVGTKENGTILLSKTHLLQVYTCLTISVHRVFFSLNNILKLLLDHDHLLNIIVCDR